MDLRVIGSSLPPGFRFYPSDEELVCHYLYKKIANEDVLKGTLVEIDLHKCEPWQLPGMRSLLLLFNFHGCNSFLLLRSFMLWLCDRCFRKSVFVPSYFRRTFIYFLLKGSLVGFLKRKKKLKEVLKPFKGFFLSSTM